MIYKQTHIIGIEEIDSHCEATNRALLVAMENIACAYSANVGYGARDIEIITMENAGFKKTIL